MANDEAASGSWFGKFYFVIVHFFLFLLGFYLIQTKAKFIEDSEKQKNVKKSQPEKNIYHSLNSYLKACFPHVKSSIRIIVDRWLNSLEHDLKKELKNIAEIVGRKKLISSIKVERSDEVPCSIENIKQHWQKDDELILDVTTQTKHLKFKIINSQKEISYFVLPPMNLKATVYLEVGRKTSLRYVEIKALREIKLSLDVAGKNKDLCNYIAQALNVVLMKPKKVTDLILEEHPNQQKTKKKHIDVPKNPTKFIIRSKSVKEVNKAKHSLNHIPQTSDDDYFVQNWSASTPRITTQQKKSKSLSRLDSVPKYIQRERELEQAKSHTALASRRFTPTPDADSGLSTPKRPSSEIYGSETSSILFEPITPLSMQTSAFSPSTDIHQNSPNGVFTDEELTFDKHYQQKEIKPKSNSFSAAMEPINGFQAIHNSLEQILNSSGVESTKLNKTAPAAPPRRSKVSKNNAPTSSNNSPKIQDAIEPKYTTSDSAQTIKTPILKRNDPTSESLRQPSKLTKSNLLRHSFHHGERPTLEYAQSLGSLSNQSETPMPLRGTVSQSALNSAIGYIPNTSSALVIEVTEKTGCKYYRIPPSMAKKENYSIKGQKLHVYNDHIFVAKHFTGTMPSCSVCSLPLKRIGGLGKQGYSCKDCNTIVHKRCHCKVAETCPMSSLPNMEIEYIGASDV
ncbi:uncharacterized protein [Clytia hemisphaerica]|uniref:Phorbol-ester/DAG-type domain-containing protein n=1 Tax=Clytia hemisphaerica TaxID=252671 RepID=A0A7M5WR68_9CNID